MNKETIPGTNPNWGRELPDDYTNSIVDANGNNYDNGYNFDEKDDHEEDDLAKELAEKRAQTEKDLSNAALKAEELTRETSEN